MSTSTPETLEPRQSRVSRQLDPGFERSDRIFHKASTLIGLSTLVLTGAIGLFLGEQSIPTLSHYGLAFFTGTQWQPEIDKIGIASVLVGTAEVALVAVCVAFPLAIMFALFISDFAPRQIKSSLISAIDLMAAVPSIIYGLWGFFLLMPQAANVSRWLAQHFGWFFLFKVNTDPNAPIYLQSRFTASAFIDWPCTAPFRSTTCSHSKPSLTN